MIFWSELLIGAVIGAVAGSTATALQHRYQNIGSFISGRSECPHCHKTLGWLELIPIVSWLKQHGKCKNCNAQIGWQSLAIEIIFAFIGAITGWYFGLAWWLVAFVVLMVIFGALILVDAQEQLLPDVLILAAIPFIVIVGWNAPTVRLSLADILEGLVFVGGALGLLWLATKGEGIGDGDVKLATVLGLGLGPQFGLIAVMCAFILGGILAGFLLATGRAKLGQRIAFGPLLILGYVIALFASPMILSWYSY